MRPAMGEAGGADARNAVWRRRSNSSVAEFISEKLRAALVASCRAHSTPLAGETLAALVSCARTYRPNVFFFYRIVVRAFRPQYWRSDHNAGGGRGKLEKTSV